MSEPARLALEPVLSSVAEARALVGSVVAGAGLVDALADDASLVVSELVTNAVLHARTTVEVAVQVEGTRVRIEVSDTSETPVFVPEPVHAPPVADLFDDPVLPDLDAVIDALATTGRGMELVASLAARWGVTAHAPVGKTVWAELDSDAASVSASVSGPAGAAAPGAGPVAPTAPTGSLGPRGGGQPWAIDDRAEEEAATQVRLVAVPLRLIVESDRSFDDTIRELQVIALGGGADGAEPDPEMVALANRVTRLFSIIGPVRFKSQDAVWAARERGDRLVDLHLAVPPDTPARLEELGAIFAAVARARTRGRLLVMPPSREAQAFRRWYRDEVLRQLGGARLQPCPFPAVRPAAEATLAGATLSERRRRLLADLCAELARCRDRVELTVRAAERVMTDTGASFVNLLLVEADGRHVSMAHRIGYSPDEQHGLRYPVSGDNPISEAVRTAEPIVLRTRDERLDRYPRLIPSGPIDANPTAVWVPLGDRPPAVGVVVVGFRRARDFTGRDLRYLTEVGAAIHERLEQLPAD